jgi:hypothetical protein
MRPKYQAKLAEKWVYYLILGPKPDIMSNHAIDRDGELVT